MARRTDFDPEQELWPGAAPAHVRLSSDSVAPAPLSDASDDEVFDIDATGDIPVVDEQPADAHAQQVPPADGPRKRSRLAKVFGLGYLTETPAERTAAKPASSPRVKGGTPGSAAENRDLADLAELPAVPTAAMPERALPEAALSEAVLPEPAASPKPPTAAAKLDARTINTDQDIDPLRVQVREFYVEVKKEAKRLAREREVFDEQRAEFIEEQTALRLLHAEVNGAREALDAERTELESERAALVQISERVTAMGADVQQARESALSEQEQAWRDVETARTEAAVALQRAQAAQAEVDAAAREGAQQLAHERASFEAEQTARNERFQAERAAFDQRSATLTAEQRAIAAERESLTQMRADLEQAEREAAEVLGRRAAVEQTVVAVERERAANAELRAQLDSERLELDIERAELVRMRDEIEASKHRIDALEARLVEETRRRAEAEEARRVLDDARTRYRELDGFMQSAETSFASLLDRRWEAWMATRSPADEAPGPTGPAVSD